MIDFIIIGCQKSGTSMLSFNLRTINDVHLPNSEIHILNGLYKGWGEILLEYDLKPVLNNFQQMDLWIKTAKLVDKPLPADIHVDTGMSRLGFLYEEIDELATKLTNNKLIKIDIILSHLACSSDPQHPANALQFSKFNKPLLNDLEQILIMIFFFKNSYINYNLFLILSF